MKNSSEPARWSDLALKTREEVADLLGITPRFLDKLVKAGRLRAIKVSRRLVRFKAKDVDIFLESGATVRYPGPPRKLWQRIGRRPTRCKTAKTRKLWQRIGRRPTRRKTAKTAPFFSQRGPSGLLVEVISV